jgi:hypothetical protein
MSAPVRNAVRSFLIDITLPFDEPRTVPGCRARFEGWNRSDHAAAFLHRFRPKEAAPVASPPVNAVTSLIELGVGLGCIAIAWTMRGRGRSYAIGAVVLAAAGAVAVVHAIWAFAIE